MRCDERSVARSSARPSDGGSTVRPSIRGAGGPAKREGIANGGLDVATSGWPSLALPLRHPRQKGDSAQRRAAGLFHAVQVSIQVRIIRCQPASVTAKCVMRACRPKNEAAPARVAGWSANARDGEKRCENGSNDEQRQATTTKKARTNDASGMPTDRRRRRRRRRLHFRMSPSKSRARIQAHHRTRSSTGTMPHLELSSSAIRGSKYRWLMASSVGRHVGDAMRMRGEKK